MSASPTSAVASAKRPLEDPSSPAGPNDMPDAKRQALDKSLNEQADNEQAEPKPAANGAHADTIAKEEASTTQFNDEAVIANGSAAGQAPQPIPSTQANSDLLNPQPTQPMPTQDESQWIHVRSVISSSEAATCIGKGGENVTQIRRLSGAKCTVSDYSRGAVERILTVSGAQDAVAKVKSLHIS